MELTEADWERIYAAAREVLSNQRPAMGLVRNDVHTQVGCAAYRAGMAAMAERAAQACESFGRAHTYVSENADHYRGFDQGTIACAERCRALAKP